MLLNGCGLRGVIRRAGHSQHPKYERCGNRGSPTRFACHLAKKPLKARNWCGLTYCGNLVKPSSWQISRYNCQIVRKQVIARLENSTAHSLTRNDELPIVWQLRAVAVAIERPQITPPDRIVIRDDVGTTIDKWLQPAAQRRAY